MRLNMVTDEPAIRRARAAGASVVEAVALARLHGDDLAAVDRAVIGLASASTDPPTPETEPRPVWEVLADMHRQRGAGRRAGPPGGFGGRVDGRGGS
ncbi:hypothetical protein [Micromonospora sp. NBC_01813]|uniref:hypothetical protein n=1 Tax=Micromonospora sp. NBC_01813 TaxID=2975988 RepID=UPI002DD80F81|nr:hypothetical protein [Micromonospora sp. NBC_01813]WSA07080.1 hypothetical protein OG958_22830 [Micromonospora sp. NBC_01813]